MSAVWNYLRRICRHKWILFSGDRCAGRWLNPELAANLKPSPRSSCGMIKSIVVPIIFGSLVTASGHGDDMKRVGRLAFK